MDSITHIAIGACIGEAFFEKGFGKKAMIWGILAQSIPDIDFISHLWLNVPESLLAHRGFTHSIMFAVLIIPFFALLADKIHQPHNISFRKWIYFFSVEVFFHLFIDAFNNYGIGWFEPFSHKRISLNTVYVADPLFSVWPALALFRLITLNKFDIRRKFWWKFGLFIPLFYLGICSFNKIWLDNRINEEFTASKKVYKSYFFTPAPLQNLLWYVVAEKDSGFDIGYTSVFDKKNKLQLHYFKKNDSLLNNVSNHEELQKLIRFSKNYYTIEKWRDTVVFNDLRFGQILGWKSPSNKFVFHYFLEHPADNRLVVQRGRFSGWNWIFFQSMLSRISGN